MADSITQERPAKPRPDFPLFPHRNGRWAKKIRGQFVYFGKWTNDPKGEAAIEKWLADKDYLLAGLTPPANRDGLTVHALCNLFTESKERQYHAGDITRQTFVDYQQTCEVILKALGKRRLVIDLTAGDFEKLRASLAKRLNPNTLGNEVQRIRTTFKFAYDSGLIEQPVRFGPTFKRPAKRILRQVRQAKGLMLFEREELQKLLEHATQPLKTMILLGVNCGLGNTDCGRLPISALDLKGGWLDYPRPKTAVERRCKLWPETVKAIKEVLAKRKEPTDPEFAGLLFVTKYGGSWAKDNPANSPVTREFKKLLKLKKVNLWRKGRNFYALRHTFETIGGESRDQVAVNHVMGHADSTMAGVYRERISDERLTDVAAYVRKWLFKKSK